MGNLHSGHLRLVDTARTLSDKTVVSIYVNPTQFAANEDLDKYPRTEVQDLQQLESKNVDVVFMPASAEMYPQNKPIDYIQVPELARQLEGRARPEHFRGVATIVKKLFDCVRPNHAIFGEKDFQQLLIVKNMVAELDLNVLIHGEAIVRDADGLAKSSRNQYLTAEQRQLAPLLQQALISARDQILAGNEDYPAIEAQYIDFINNKGFKVDYFSVRDAESLGPPTGQNRVIVVAAKLGNTRLLDNLRVD
jgi:pantoate--beta-alanine ligase